MSKHTFTVKYDGDSLANHEMDVAILAPALMGLGRIVEEVSKMESGGEYTAKLSIKGNVKAGSIEIALVSEVISLVDQVTNLLTGRSMTAVVNFSAIICTIVGAYQLLKKIQGEQPHAIEKNADGSFILHFDDFDETVNSHIFHIYNDFDLRNEIYKTVKPLEEDGIDEFAVIDEDNNQIMSIAKNEAGYFRPIKVVDKLNESTAQKILVIETITFKDGNKWTFSDGSYKINATITDEAFINLIETGERFAKGDWLEVLLKTTQVKENGKLKTEHEIVKVIKHLTKEQYKLDI